jgi:hypothetical protein
LRALVLMSCSVCWAQHPADHLPEEAHLARWAGQDAATDFRQVPALAQLATFPRDSDVSVRLCNSNFSFFDHLRGIFEPQSPIAKFQFPNLESQRLGSLSQKTGSRDATAVGPAEAIWRPLSKASSEIRLPGFAGASGAMFDRQPWSVTRSWL